MLKRGGDSSGELGDESDQQEATGVPPIGKNKICRKIRVNRGALVPYSDPRTSEDIDMSSPSRENEGENVVEGQDDLSPLLPDDPVDPVPIPLIMQERGWGQVITFPQAPQIVPVHYGIQMLDEIIGRMTMAVNRAESFTLPPNFSMNWTEVVAKFASRSWKFNNGKGCW